MGHLQILIFCLQFHLTFPRMSFSLVEEKIKTFDKGRLFLEHSCSSSFSIIIFLINFIFSLFFENEMKIAGSSRGFEKGRKNLLMETEDSGSFSPSTPPLTASSSCRIAKRRKGIPHRSPMG